MPDNDEQPNPQLDEVREILFGDLVERVKKLESGGPLTGAAGIIRRIDELEASFHRELADLREQLRAEKASRVSADTQQEEDNEEHLNALQGRIEQMKERVDRNAFEIRRLITEEGKRLEKQLEKRGEEQVAIVRQSMNELQKRRGS